MGGKKKHAEEHVNLERWLVSYADFITLLFATFVVLYALSQMDLAKYKELKISLQKAFSRSPSVLQGDAGMLSSAGDNMIDSGGFVNEQNMIPAILDAIAAKEEEKNFEVIQEELKLEKIDEIKGIKTRVTERGLIITLVGNIFFESGASNLKEGSMQVIQRIGEKLREKFPFNIIRVEGHTDNQPINSGVYPSNWELSAARAASIVRYFINNSGIDGDRFVVVGYGSTRPVSTNITEDGRNSNRRVQIVVLRSKLVKTELQTYKFQKERMERLKRIKERIEQEQKREEEISDAAKKLLDNVRSADTQVILSPEKYDRQTQELMKEIKKYEEEADARVKKKAFFESVQKELRRD